MAQNLVKGTILDEFQQPIENVTIAIDGSSLSTKSNSVGEFSINFPNGVHNLVFKHLAFQTKTISVNSNQNNYLTIVLIENPIELEEANVKVMSQEDWEYYYSIFKDNFLGIDEAARKCKIQNPKTLRFSFDSDKKVLSATAKDPLIIENQYLGYLVEYDLNTFEMDYKNEYLLVLGSSFFQDLKGNKSKNRKWNINREIAYNGSFTHFLKSVYEKKLVDEGFILRRYIRKDNPAYLEALTKIKNGIKDVVLPSKKIAFLINQEVPYDSIIKKTDQKVMMDFDGLYSIEYQNEKEDLEYVSRIKRGRFVGNQTSLFSLKSPVEITSEGFYHHPADLVLEEYITWEKFAHLLPIDYKRNFDQK